MADETKRVRVRFTDVGARRMTWEADLRDAEYATLVREIHKRHALVSRVIDFGEDGTIWVGGFWRVGRYEVDRG